MDKKVVCLVCGLEIGGGAICASCEEIAKDDEVKRDFADLKIDYSTQQDHEARQRIAEIEETRNRRRDADSYLR